MILKITILFKIVKGGILMALNCISYNCIHNDNDGKCFAKIIAVKGRNATTTDSTTCDSYVPAKEWQNFEFANDFMEAEVLPSNAQNIKCSAKNCMYNFNTACTATNVEIDEQDANSSCITFKA